MFFLLEIYAHVVGCVPCSEDTLTCGEQASPHVVIDSKRLEAYRMRTDAGGTSRLIASEVRTLRESSL